MLKIAFIQQEFREYIGIMLLSAKLKEAGHETDVLIIKDKELYDLALLKNIDIFAFSSSTISFEKDLKIAKQIKDKTNKFIIFGGAHPTYHPEETIKHESIDAICIGEGLGAIVELANNINRRDIKNLWFKNNIKKKYADEYSLQTNKYLDRVLVNYDYKIIKNELRPISNINDWLRPDYDLYYKKYPLLANKATKGVYIVRGCPYFCQFCYNPAYNKMYKGQKIFQCMDVDKAISEIKWLKDNYGFKYLQFISDNMTIKKKWLKKFMNEYKATINIPYLMNCRANEVNKEIVQLLKDTGCNRVDFGVEHGNDFIRNDILKRNMSKGQIIQCGKWFNEAGIRVQTTNIFGLPHENFNRAWESVELNRQFVPEISKACILQPFKNTGVYNYAKEKGLLKKDMEYSGTTFQIGVNDNRSDESKIKIDNEKQVIKLSYLFDWFVKNRNIPRWLGFLICSLPLNYKGYYKGVFKRQEAKYTS